MTKEEFQIKLGARIAKLRKDKKLSQVALADLLDKEKQSINRIESGGTNPSSWLLTKIAEILEVHPSQLFDFIPPKK